jgi:hypothetical protein
MEKSKLCFIQNSQNKNEYFLKVCTPEFAEEEYINKLNHRNGYEESGYPHIPCEFAIAIDIPDEIYELKDEWVSFVVSTFGVEKHQEPFLKGLGWFEFSEIKYSDNWLTSFNSFQKQRQREFQQANNSGVQVGLF